MGRDRTAVRFRCRGRRCRSGAAGQRHRTAAGPAHVTCMTQEWATPLVHVLWCASMHANMQASRGMQASREVKSQPTCKQAGKQAGNKQARKATHKWPRGGANGATAAVLGFASGRQAWEAQDLTATKNLSYCNSMEVRPVCRQHYSPTLKLSAQQKA